MRRRSRQPAKNTNRIVAQCTRWEALGWGFCVPNNEPNRSIYVHCSRVVGAGNGFVKLQKYALYEFEVLPPEPGKRYEMADKITLPGGQPIPVFSPNETKILRNIMIKERKKRESTERFLSSRSTSEGGLDSSLISDDSKRDDSSLGELSYEGESTDLSQTTLKANGFLSGAGTHVETDKRKNNTEHERRRPPPGLAGKFGEPRMADRRKKLTKSKYTEWKNYSPESKTKPFGEPKPRNFEMKPKKLLETTWKEITADAHTNETEWSPVTDCEWTNIQKSTWSTSLSETTLPSSSPQRKIEKDHTIWSSNTREICPPNSKTPPKIEMENPKDTIWSTSSSLWSPVYAMNPSKNKKTLDLTDSVLKDDAGWETYRTDDVVPVDSARIGGTCEPWEPVACKKIWEPVGVVDSVQRPYDSRWASAV